MTTSMSGSGFNSYGATGFTFTCEWCEHENIKVDGYVDDDNMFWGECVKCDALTDIKEEEQD
jgi:hypothetical protein